jgi:excinuclease UvrABC helicase subunit UvrB
MIRAIVRHGTIHPLEAIPSEWSEGAELVVDLGSEPRQGEIDRWEEELRAAAAELDLEDDERLRDAVSEVRRHAKDVARVEMGSG